MERCDVFYRFGSFRFDPRAQVLFDGDREIAVPRRAIVVLEALLERPGELVERRVLEDLVWPETAVTAASLTEAISSLRHALGDDPREPRFIQTVHRRGYRFVAQLEVVAHTPAPVATGPRPKWRPSWRTAAAVALLVGIAFAVEVGRESEDGGSINPLRLEIEPPDGHELPRFGPMLAVSPDGRNVVFGAHRSGHWRLFLRSLDDFEERPIAGTESGYAPFFSPDGESIGFFAGFDLKTVRLDGGSPVVIGEVNGANGGAWVTGDTPAGTIVFSEGITSGLKYLPAEGGEIRVLTEPDHAGREYGHLLPQPLPNHPAVLFTIVTGALERNHIAVANVEDGRVVTVSRGNGAQFAAGHLLYADDGAIQAAPFDLARLAITGPASTLPEPVLSEPGNPIPSFAVSRGGTLVYVPRPEVDDVFRIMRLQGESVEPLELPARRFRNLDLSPDGRRLALTAYDNKRSDIWIGDLGSGELFRLTTEGYNVEPIWTPDGESVAYASNRSGHFQLFVQSADGGPAQMLAPSEAPRFPSAWTPDGEGIVFTQFNPATNADIGLARRTADGWDESWLVQTPKREATASLSPDGRWLAWAQSHEGRLQVFAQPLDRSTPPHRLSPRGGDRPHWTPDGRQLVFLRGDRRVCVADFDPETGRFGALRVLETELTPETVVPTAERDAFLAIPSTPFDPPSSFRVVLNWEEELSQAAPQGAGTASLALFASYRPGG